MNDDEKVKAIKTALDRSALMAKIRSKNTKPNLIIRRLAYGLGYRYRLHRKDLPGKPDLVFARRKKVIFVHGCFWHSYNWRAKSNRDYWIPKLERNLQRASRAFNKYGLAKHGVMGMRTQRQSSSF